MGLKAMGKMAAAGIDFGSHTVTHCILSHCPRLGIERELAESKAALEGLLGGTIDMLAYPDGQYSREVVECARAVGYRVGVTTINRRTSERNDRLCLPRLGVSCGPLAAVQVLFPSSVSGEGPEVSAVESAISPLAHRERVRLRTLEESPQDAAAQPKTDPTLAAFLKCRS